jgi:hypothetical protein
VLQSLADLIQSTADWLFVPVLVIVLFGTGLFLTVRCARSSEDGRAAPPAR